MKTDADYMQLAINEAQKAALMDEVPVGAIIIDDMNKIIGTGYNQPISLNDPTAHAEILALRMAAQNLNNYRLLNTTIYVTLEPCIMCMSAIIHARVKRLVFGAKDPKGGGAGSFYDLASDKRLNHNVKTDSGILSYETSNIIKNFFKNKRSK
ncbi:MAG: tRNA adenosine(34) deaminase TadA [Desulfobacteraceae bacterium]|nr:tRNA adenosine(34) deaminase TadA [Desulfobacteraceae bacterium]